MIPEVGQRFGPYEILGRLGSGAMGLVFRAWDARLHREVAIKMLHEDYDMPGMRERFLQEARAASALNHPHICTIFDLGEQDGEPYMVMELLQGETLKEKIGRGAVPVDEIVSYAQEVADALAVAHAKGIVHRDIKPANIFLVDQPNGRRQAKVLDFGLAKIGLGMWGGRASRALDLTLVGATVGTLSYMSPEQARGQNLDERSDLFSLGVVMYEMATRQVPFQGATSALIFVQLLNHSPEPLHEWNESIPKDLEKIILKLLAKERDSRFQTANELAVALRKIPFRSGGGWLKRAAAAVPLVKAADPVARSKRPLKPSSEPNRGRVIALPTQAAAPVTYSPAANYPAAVATLPAVAVMPAAYIAPVVPAALQSTMPVTAMPVFASTAPASDMAVRKMGHESSGSNMLIRPVLRIPQRQKDSGVRDVGVLRGKKPVSQEAPIEVVAAATEIPAPVELVVEAEKSDVEVVVVAPVAPVSKGDSSSEYEMVEIKPEVVPAAPATIAPVLPELPKPKLDEEAKAPEVLVVPVEPHVRKPRRAPAKELAGLKDVGVQAVESSEFDLAADAKARRQTIWIALAAGLLFVALAGGFLVMNHGRFGPVLLQQGDPLLLTMIQNRTGEKSLDGVMIEGLELMLEQTPYLTIRGSEAYRAGIRQVEAEGSTGGSMSSRKVAQLVGAKAYLYGEIRSADGMYTISVDVLKTDSNDKLASIEEKAEGREQIAAALGRVAAKVRSDVGETDRSIAKTNRPLEEQASSNLLALQAYALGEEASQGGRTADAIAAYRQATVADAKFSQAHLRLAWLYREEMAESTAAEEAKLALDTAEGRGDRLKLLTQFCFEMNATGDTLKAAGVMRQFKELFPRDGAGSLGTARVLRAQGHLPEALQAAQQALAEDPYDGEAYAEAELSMVGLDRYRDALQLQDQARRSGVVRSGVTLSAAYLGADQSAMDNVTATIQNRGGLTKSAASLGMKADYGLYLDNEGQLAAGTALWQAAAASAAENSATRAGLTAAQPAMLAQAALDRALTKSCAEATSFGREAEKLKPGMVATFKIGMASALCGDRPGGQRAVADLKLNYPQSSAVAGYYVADLNAAMALRDNDAKGALAALGGAASFDQISLTPYLRGLAHLANGEGALAAADFQTILDHRGAAFLAGSNVYPMAQIGLARAYAAIGDTANSTAASRSFTALWQGADRDQLMLAGASRRSH
jgi:serine/threonine protein kinase/tetratricopeptide (TPR) repeat protein